MAFTRRLGVIGILGASWLLAVACNDDGDKTSNSGDAGEAGEAPSGGKVSAGGSQSSGGAMAGKGGAAAGSSGKGGVASGGNSGTAGTGASSSGASFGGAGAEGGVAHSAGGEGGNAPVAGTASGGEGGATPSAGGQGGSGADAGPTLAVCDTECETSPDCVVDGSLSIFTCDPVTHRCVADDSCNAGADCEAAFNAWLPCATSAECDPDFERCATWQGAGYCMPRNLDDCNFGDVAATLVEFGNTDYMVDVCYTPTACADHVCQPGCELIGCGNGDGDTCSDVTHLCTCDAAGECDSGVCSSDHSCAQCATSQDCVDKDTAGFDVCVDGKCGCSGANSCPDNTAAGTPVCE